MANSDWATEAFGPAHAPKPSTTPSVWPGRSKSRWAQLADGDRQCTGFIPATESRCTNRPFAGTPAHPFDGLCSTCQDGKAYAKASAEGRYQGD